jgi:N-acetylmuramoyl-L-alanine amidase
MSKYLWLIDCGHGGIDANGHYTTAPAKMHKFSDGLLIQEGVVNRAIGKKTTDLLSANNIKWLVINEDVNDTPLSARTNAVNKIYERNRNAVLISIHCNASPIPEKPAQGLEIFAYDKASDKSKILAQAFCETAITNLSEFPLRKQRPNQLYKLANFHMLRESNCPAILIENLFMDNRKEAEFLLSENGKDRLANWVASTILKIEKSNLI